MNEVLSRHNGTFQQISTKHEKNPIRTGAAPIEGYFYKHPTAGESFRFFAKSLTVENDFRMIATSIVDCVYADGKVLRLTTRNSVYEVAVGETTPVY